jgi:superfamily I DNA/RNA helicase
MNVALKNTSHLSTQYTNQQIAIFHWVVNGAGHAVVIARAGCGKTFSALGAIRHMLGSVTIGQFNHSIAKETRGKLVEDGIDAESITFHAAGWRALTRRFPKVKLTGIGPKQAGYHKWDAIVRRLNIPQDYVAFAEKAVSFAKQRALGCMVKQETVRAHATAGHDVTVRCRQCNTSKPVDCAGLVKKSYGDKRIADLKFRCTRCSGTDNSVTAYVATIENYARWEQIVDDYDLADKLEGMIEAGIKPRNDIIRDGIEWAIKALTISNSLLEVVADHDDQIYGPLVVNAKIDGNDWLIVDEAQDTNPARRHLAMRMLNEKGRSLWIGDPAQAIYRFTGADSNAMDIVIRDLKATVLKLTMTFRVPKIIVAMAQEFVPDFEAAASNRDGTYAYHKYDEFFTKIAKDLTENTLVLCRNTAPLVKAALRLIALGKACRVIGKDIGSEILSLILRWKARTVRTLQERMTAYLETETVKLSKLGKDEKIEALTDRVETVRAVISGLDPNATMEDLIARVNTMFPKKELGCDGKKVIRLLSIHRSKGMEEHTVVLLGRKETIPSKHAKSDEARQQERNLAYVGLTRTFDTLHEVALPV